MVKLSHISKIPTSLLIITLTFLCSFYFFFFFLFQQNLHITVLYTTKIHKRYGVWRNYGKFEANSTATIMIFITFEQVWNYHYHGPYLISVIFCMAIISILYWKVSIARCYYCVDKLNIIVNYLYIASLHVTYYATAWHNQRENYNRKYTWKGFFERIGSNVELH